MSLTLFRSTMAYLILGSVAVLSSSEARAEQVIPLGDESKNMALHINGEYRIQATVLSDYQVDAEGLMHGQTFVLDQRLRAGLHFVFQDLKIGTEWDLFSGQLFGTTWAFERNNDERLRHQLGTVVAPAGFVPRRAAITYSRPSIEVEAGLITSSWGLGLLANSGDRDPLFGRSDFGDRVVRLRVTRKPLYDDGSKHKDKLFMTAAFDWVIADDTARFVDRQLALQGILSLVWADPQRGRLGTYMVYRNQSELGERAEPGQVPPAKRFTRALVLDVFGELPVSFGDSGWGMRLSAEAALIGGRSNRATSYNAKDSLTLNSFGFAGSATVIGLDSKLKFHLRGGLASGDSDSDDERSTAFTFDRDFDVGFVLFDQLQGSIEAATYNLLTDPSRSPPPDGVETITSEGSFRQAGFIQPAVQFQALPWLQASLGVLFAGSTVDVISPYYSFRAGGSPRNYLDQEPSGRYLGTELDWGLKLGGRFSNENDSSPSIEGLVQGGHLFVGKALQGDKKTIHEILVTVRLRW